MTKLGELLKSEREKKGLSLHEIGMSLKINPKILKAIEDGDQANLPAKTFLRGFVKSYAQYLRLDVNQAIGLFQDEYGSPRPEPTTTTPASVGTSSTPSAPQQTQPKFESTLKRPDDAALPVSNNNRIYTILLAILLLTLIAFVAKMMDKYQKESRDAKTEVTETLNTTTTTLAPLTSEAQAPMSTGTLSSQPSPTTTLPAMATSTSSGTLTTPTTTTTTTTTSSTTLAPTTTTTTTLKPALVEVIVEALNRVNIRFSLNGGQKWESLELNADQVHTFRSRSSIQLEVSDGGAVNVIVNGRDKGVPGTIGRPLKLNFP